jgi:hypothetical protein
MSPLVEPIEIVDCGRFDLPDGAIPLDPRLLPCNFVSVPQQIYPQLFRFSGITEPRPLFVARYQVPVDEEEVIDYAVSRQLCVGLPEELFVLAASRANLRTFPKQTLLALSGSIEYNGRSYLGVKPMLLFGKRQTLGLYQKQGGKVAKFGTGFAFLLSGRPLPKSCTCCGRPTNNP